MSVCNICPRKCGIDREKALGYCRMPSEIYIARAALHMYEEPCISGKCGSGTIFFCGCNLRCVYCQNGSISRGKHSEISGRAVSEGELADIMLRLEGEGAHNINLVTPTHYSDKLASVLENVRHKLKIPVVYNCGGYESVEALKKLDGLVDIYMPDFKYFSPELSMKYSRAENYAAIASEALSEMYLQVGEKIFDSDGMLTKGLLIRHLVLPGCRHDSADALRKIAEAVPPDKILISIMRQYTPDFAPDAFKELKRKITSFEYSCVLSEAERLGFDGFSQGRESVSCNFTPDFSEKTF